MGQDQNFILVINDESDNWLKRSQTEYQTAKTACIFRITKQFNLKLLDIKNNNYNVSDLNYI